MSLADLLAQGDIAERPRGPTSRGLICGTCPERR